MLPMSLLTPYSISITSSFGRAMHRKVHLKSLLRNRKLESSACLPEPVSLSSLFFTSIVKGLAEPGRKLRVQQLLFSLHLKRILEEILLPFESAS